MKTALLLLAALVAVTAADSASAAYAELRTCPSGSLGAGVYVDPPGATAGLCCTIPELGPQTDAACRRL